MKINIKATETAVRTTRPRQLKKKRITERGKTA